MVEGNISFVKHNLESGAYFLHRKKEKKIFNIQPFFPLSYFWVLVYCSLSSMCVSLLWSWSHMQFRPSHGPRHLLWSSQRGFIHGIICVFVQSPERHHSKYNPWSCSCPPDLLSCPVSLEWAWWGFTQGEAQRGGTCVSGSQSLLPGRGSCWLSV